MSDSGPLLTLITFLPLLGMVAILFIPSRQKEWIKIISLIFTLPSLVLGVRMLIQFDPQVGYQFIEKASWIPAFNIHYYMGVDGLSVPMVFLTVLLCPICILASWGIEDRIKGYCAMFLLLETGMLGVFCALDLFLFYVFWELMLLPMYFLIGIWGGPRKEYAAIKFFLYTLFGSVFLLLAMIAMWLATTPHSFDMTQLNEQLLQSGVGATFRNLCFVAMYVAFAIKIPAFPFHTWLPDAHVEAPTAISVILAGILLKMGTYGILRVSYPIFPDSAKWFAPVMVAIALINIVYGSLCAMAQKDLKKLVAYSSIAHMGYVMLGMASFTPAAMNGAVFQMFNHGTITAMLFLLVGVIYDRAHHRDIDGFGGLAAQTPIYAGITSLAFFAALGLPGLSGFISEVLVFLGAFPSWPIVTILSTSGIVLTAGYMLWTFQRMFLGPLNEKYRTLPEINARELVTLVPLAIIVLFLGIYPAPMLNIFDHAMRELLRIIL
ncbi:MAG TPA: NADH-quinone oxidoreductase subunit M [bacterium]|nr:NADH-quinone oxidoreductase subunit M [bacterium]HQP97096.1 NADH-quinone oxidoreductase subunit M [bacterium]